MNLVGDCMDDRTRFGRGRSLAAPLRIVLAAAALLVAATASGQTRARPDVTAALDAQRAALGKLSLYDGLYTGTWKSFPLDGGKPFGGTTVHRVGPFLNGTIKLMEGRNYAEDGSLVFNGLMVLSFDRATGRYPLRIGANGRPIETEAVMEAGRYHFDVPMPGAASFRRINIAVSPRQWIKRVDYRDGTRPPVEEAELVLNRVGETDWPLARPNPTPALPR